MIVVEIILVSLNLLLITCETLLPQRNKDFKAIISGSKDEFDVLCTFGQQCYINFWKIILIEVENFLFENDLIERLLYHFMAEELCSFLIQNNLYILF